MNERFDTMLAVDGKKNSLGRVNDVIAVVVADHSRLEELYQCMFNDDAWVRMRAADAFEKIGREHSDWLEPYVDRLQSELSTSDQPSIQWHLAQIYRQTPMTSLQIQHAIAWAKNLLSTVNVDWIVAANTMDTLAFFTKLGHLDKSELKSLLDIQEKHKSSAVVKRSLKITNQLFK